MDVAVRRQAVSGKIKAEQMEFREKYLAGHRSRQRVVRGKGHGSHGGTD